MDYKKKYEALVGGIKGWLDKYVGDWQRGVFNLPFDKTGEIAKDIIKLVPELAEGEDERIRRCLLDFIKNNSETPFTLYAEFTPQQYISYLERQKEQKPAEYNEADSKLECREWAEKYYPNQTWEIKDMIAHGYLAGRVNAFMDAAQAAKEKYKPAEWSDTNELVFKDICKHLKEEGYNGWIETLEALHNGEPKQPIAGWSEEDEKMLNLIVEIFEVNHPNDFFKANEINTIDMHGVHTEEIISWLKSLRPVKKGLGEEDVDAMVKEFSDNLPLCGEFQTYHDALAHTYRQGIEAALNALYPKSN